MSDPHHSTDAGSGSTPRARTPASRMLGAMVRKDLRRQIASPLAPVILLLFPLMFSALLALTFGGGDSPQLPKVRLLVEDHDQSLVGNLLRSAFSSKQAAEYFDMREVDEGEGRAAMDRGEASALLILPTGLTDALLDGEPSTLEVVRNPSETILPEAAVQTTEVLAAGLDAATRLLQEPLTTLRPLLEADEDEFPTDIAVATLAVEVNRVLRSSQTYLMPPVLDLEVSSGSTEPEALDELAARALENGEETTVTAEAADAEDGSDSSSRSLTATVFLLILPGVSVFSLFSLGDRMMRDLPREAQMGTLTRQLSSPLSAGLLIFGKVVVTGLFILAGLVILAICGVLFGGARADLLGFISLSAALTLAVCGTTATLYALSRNEAQGSTIASVLFLILGFASGSLLPLDNLPGIVQSIAPFTPFYWATEGFKSLLFEDAGVKALAPNLTILTTFGIVLMAVSAKLLQRRVLRGDL